MCSPIMIRVQMPKIAIELRDNDFSEMNQHEA